MPSPAVTPSPATAATKGRRARRKRPMLRFALWCRSKLSPNTLLFTVATIVGVMAGLGAGLLKNMIGIITSWITAALHSTGVNWFLLALPVAGIMITGIFQRDVARRKLEHGVSQLLAALRMRRLRMPPSLMILPMIANSITLGFGGSAGAEGPIAYSGAAMGSNLARWLHLPPHMMLILIGCGAGAGIAGIFKAPLGGVLFTLEVMRMELTTVSVIALFIASLAGGLTAYATSGFSLDVTVTSPIAFHTSDTGWIVLLGVFCGIYSLYYSGVMKGLAGRYDSIQRPWLRNLTSGSVLAVSVFLFPALYGEGYDMMGTVLDGTINRVVAFSAFRLDRPWMVLAAAAGILMLKAVAAASTTSGGGVAGEFAPSLFAGCIAGLVFAEGMNFFFATELPTGIFALCGMSAVMAGAIRAPLMAIFIVSEMTGYYGLLFPLTLSAAISYIVSRFLSRQDYFHRLHWRHAQ